MNKLEAEFNARKKELDAEREAYHIKLAVEFANEIRTVFPSFKATVEGGTPYNRCLFGHRSHATEIWTGKTTHHIYVCTCCGAVELPNIHYDRMIWGYINPNKETLNIIKETK
jgi:hypothetical protein